MLNLADILLTLLHLIIIFFNLFAWIFPSLRKAHFVCAAVTAFCWFVLGIWFGWGYCLVTDLQWHVKYRLGETNLPASFITYYADKISGMRFRDSLIDALTLVLFLAVAIISVYFNFFKIRKNKTSHSHS